VHLQPDEITSWQNELAVALIHRNRAVPCIKKSRRPSPACFRRGRGAPPHLLLGRRRSRHFGFGLTSAPSLRFAEAVAALQHLCDAPAAVARIDRVNANPKPFIWTGSTSWQA
jgi:hypothetical protein